ncbi:dihydrodipicolinate synthase family protein [Nesterenkonia salmonea]|uniref:Dihydrodipicolinate synthase family protein n=1 Tax=Nesterenkonia salmonea TaxID=1804987 RepID=A0A5R9BAM7_9MICC|nr:dihydrodipicolinate synthase family protein [Nesterenkonia salmonea]TLP94864.1 dihydrodipicolinate synthase family protein [Nesterenkonia salmonea]
MFTGLSAFPLTPIKDDAVDEAGFVRLIERLTSAGVDSITALGSTGSYAYLSPAERARVAELAVTHAKNVPVIVGVGSLRTSDVITNVENAQQAGASGLLVAPMSYQPLTEDEVYGLFRAVTEIASVPVVVYDNPTTTHFTFSTELYGRIATLPAIASIKIPPVDTDLQRARARVEEIRSVIPGDVTIGISGDSAAAIGLLAGCDAWYSVIAGTLPELAQRISRPALNGDLTEALAASQRLTPLWDLFAEHGSLRVVAAIAEHFRLTDRPNLPAPMHGLSAVKLARVRNVLEDLEVTPL